MAEHNSIFHEEKITHSLSSKNEKSKVTTFRFLKPCTKVPNQAVKIPRNPLLSDIFPKNLARWPSKVEFRGWRLPQMRWEEWMDRLCGKYNSLWTKVGICDAILSSKYVVYKQEHLVLALSEIWCSETNTCVFPWGEATISLEDVMILGGFPVPGEAVTAPLDREMMNVERELEKQWSEMSRSKAKKADHSAWMNYFMDKKGELEHAAFLSLWLSRYVFPSSTRSIAKNVFSIAVKLSRGIKVSLAPAVLAGIYRDMRVLREGVIATKETIALFGLFQLVHLWVFEHFPILRPKTLNSLKGGEPRVAIWQETRSKVQTRPQARSIFADIRNFKWRPYAADLENWRHDVYYGENKHIYLLKDSCLNSELRSFFKCVSVHEVVGLDSVEDYSPHRIARQFGYDQDLPYDPVGFKLVSDSVKFFVPSRSLQGLASKRYTKWYKEMMINHCLAVQSVLKKEKFSKILKASSLIHANSTFPIDHEIRFKKEMNKTFEAQNISVKKIKEEAYRDSSDDDNTPIAKRSRKTPNHDSKVAIDCNLTNTPIANTLIKEEVSRDSSDDDNIPIAKILSKKINDSKVTIDSGKDFLCASTAKRVDGTSRKRVKIATDFEDGVIKRPVYKSVGPEVEGNVGSTVKFKIEASCFFDEPLKPQLKEKDEKSANGVIKSCKLGTGDWFDPIKLDD